MTAVHRAVLEKGGPVLQFDHPLRADGSRSDMLVIVNLFGSKGRVAALGLVLTLLAIWEVSLQRLKRQARRMGCAMPSRGGRC